MRLVFIGYLQGYGGAEKQIIKLANEMANRKHEVYFISMAFHNEKYKLSNNIKRIKINDKKRFRIINRFLMLKKEMKSIKPDVTINFWFQSAYFCAAIKKYCGKIIYSERGDPGDKEYKGLLGIIRKIVLPRIDGFVFQSESARNYFNSKVKNRSTIIFNPVDVDFKKNINTCRKNKIINVGRLHNQKNQKLLIEAFTAISRKYKDYSLEIYGDGEEKENLSTLIKKNKMENKIFLKGTTENIFEKIAESSMFVLCSNYEGMPNALVEAMILGVPCISTNYSPGGVTEIITNRKNGIIVEKNNVNELANAISYIIENREFAKKIASEASRISGEFKKEKIYKQWEDFLIGQVK